MTSVSQMSDIQTSMTQQSSTDEQELCLSFDEAIKELPEFLKPDDVQEQNELAIFLSQVDHLHKPVVGKVSANSIFNYLQQLFKPITQTSEEGASQATFPDQLSLHSGNIATEIVCSVIRGVDNIHDITMSVLNVLREFPWETKVALTLTTFVLTFGDNGLNLSEESQVSVNDILMFAKIKGRNKHQLETNSDDQLFKVVLELIGFIVKFENLPEAHKTSKDPRVKVCRTHLIVSIYWIIKFIVAAATSHIIKSSSRGGEFKTTISILWETHSRWTKKFETLSNTGYHKSLLLQLQDLLKEDVNIETYNRIKNIVEQDNPNDNMEVLNALIPSSGGDAPQLYDCLRKRKVHLNELKGEYVLLFISELNNIVPEVDDTKLNEFIDSVDSKIVNQNNCNIVWIPMVNNSRQNSEATQTFKLKPYLDWYYLVRQIKLLKIDEYDESNFKGWYSIGDPLMISNEVKKLFKDDWNYEGEPIIVVLDAQGKVTHLNAIHMLYIWGEGAFPVTSEMEKKVSKFRHIIPMIELAFLAFKEDQVKGDGYTFIYGGENIEWIRSFTGMVREAARELGLTINMVYVGQNHNQEVMKSVKEENLSDCLSDPILVWLFWKRLESSSTYLVLHGKTWIDYMELRYLQKWSRCDKSNAGWAVLMEGPMYYYIGHGKVVLTALKEFELWKDKASEQGFYNEYRSRCAEVEREICLHQRLEFPTSALQGRPVNPKLMICPYCQSQTEQYTTFYCYHH